MALGRRLTQFQTLLAQQSLRSAIAKPRPLPNPHSRFLRCSSPQAAASRSPSSHFLWRSSGSAGTLLPVSSAAAVAAAARAAAKRWLTARAAGSLELFSLQRRRSSGWLSSSSAFLRGAPWARWLPSPDGVVLMLIGANVAVYMLWQLADPSFMMNHFTISLDNVKSGRLHTVLTSAFSHKDGHLFSNMIGFYFFGSSISSMFGPSFLLYLYAAGAVVGSTFFLIEKAFIAPRKQVYLGWDGSRDYLLGASGAVNAIMLLQIFLNPKGLIYFYFVIPVPAALVGAAWIGLDLLRVNKGQASGSTHLGGALVAALVWARIRKGWI